MTSASSWLHTHTHKHTHTHTHTHTQTHTHTHTHSRARTHIHYTWILLYYKYINTSTHQSTHEQWLDKEGPEKEAEGPALCANLDGCCFIAARNSINAVDECKACSDCVNNTHPCGTCCSGLPEAPIFEEVGERACARAPRARVTPSQIVSLHTISNRS